MGLFEKYKAAEGLLPRYTREAVLNGRPSIYWADGIRFSYTRQVRGEQGVKAVKVTVDSVTGEEWTEEAEAGGQMVRVEPETGRRISGEDENPETAIGRTDLSFSPDRRWALLIRNHNLVLRENASLKERQLTEDGEELLEYGCYLDIYSQVTAVRDGSRKQPQALWSPDGRYFVTYRADRRRTGKLYLLESFADSEEKLRPGLWEYPCPFVTDKDEEIPHYALFVGDTEKGTFYQVDSPEYLYPVFTSEAKSYVKWLENSKAFYFTWVARGYQEGRLYLCDPADGSTRLLVKETTDQFLNLGAFGQLDGYGSYQFSNFVTEDMRYAFWQSERSGFGRLYRYSLCSQYPEGCLEGDVLGDAEESMIVQKIVKVDERAGRIYFMANQVPGCSDPLYYQLYAVNFDGENVKRLTPEDGTHQISMGEQAFVDTWSRIDLPPVTVLRRLDGSLVRELERADVSALLEAGYVMPERFTVRAADGKTGLCGILVRPADWKEDETYPVIDYIYGGAQLYNVPREFTWDNSMDREVMGGLQEFAQLGFAGIILDGRGTPGRGMEFHSFSWHNIHGCAGLADHRACAGELKEKYPFLDMDRVGIWGNSGGGYATVSAMFEYPDFYKAGVASSGNYDQRMYEHSWTERYNGLYDPKVYCLGDITRLAGNLKGKLLLAYGAMDDNVSMSQTLRLCDELNRQNKDYDLLVLPRKNHNVPSDLYFIRRKLDFFVKHLLGVEPPKEFRFEDMR